RASVGGEGCEGGDEAAGGALVGLEVHGDADRLQGAAGRGPDGGPAGPAGGVAEGDALAGGALDELVDRVDARHDDPREVAVREARDGVVDGRAVLDGGALDRGADEDAGARVAERGGQPGRALGRARDEDGATRERATGA